MHQDFACHVGYGRGEGRVSVGCPFDQRKLRQSFLQAASAQFAPLLAEYHTSLAVHELVAAGLNTSIRIGTFINTTDIIEP